MIKSITALCLFLLAWNSPNPPDKKAIRCFRWTMSVPTIDPQGKVHGNFLFIDKKIFVCDGVLMVQREVHHAEYVHDSLIKEEEWPLYFVYQQDSATGFQYEVHFPDSVKRLYVDSTNRAEGISEPGPVALLGKTAHLVSGKKDSASGVLTEAYTGLGKGETSDEDTCYLYFSDRLKDIPACLTLDRSLDKLHQMRLVEVRCLIAAGFSKEQNLMLDKFEVTWKLEEQPFFNRDTALTYFTRYQTDCRK